MRRALVYFHFNAHDQVDEYVLDVLRSLKPFCEFILFVSNSSMSQASHNDIDAWADHVIVRSNSGYDVGAYKDAIAYLRETGQLSHCDELILTNHTYFAPLQPWDRVFSRTDRWDDVDIWGLTEHAEVRPHPFAPKPVMAAHLQSHWIAVRHRVLCSPEFSSYWETMPPIRSYRDSIALHESRFTEEMSTAGFRTRALFAASQYVGDNPALDDPETLIADGCPILKRRLFFHDPQQLLYSDQRSRSVLDLATSHGLDADRVLSGVVREATPRTLLATAGLTTCVDAGEEEDISAAELRSLMHDQVAIFVPANVTARIKDSIPLGWIPGCSGTTWSCYVRHASPGELTASAVLACWKAALSGACQDDSSWPVVIVASPTFNVELSDSAREHHAALILRHCVALMSRHSSLGLIIPKTPEQLFGIMRRHTKDACYRHMIRSAERLGITDHLDQWTPLACYEGILAMRVGALDHVDRLMTVLEEHPGERHEKGRAADLLLATWLAQQGWHTRQLASREELQDAFGRIERAHEQLVAYLPADQRLRQPYLAARHDGVRGMATQMRIVVADKHPALSSSLKPLYRRVQTLLSGR